jgi:hypothetical protein
MTDSNLGPRKSDLPPAVTIAVALLAVLFFIGLAFLVGFLRGSGKGLFGPTSASDAEVIKQIGTWEVPIPKGARKLTFLQRGFISTDVWIAMEVSPGERDDLESNWLHRGNAKPRPMTEGEMENFNPRSLPYGKDFEGIDLTRFDSRDWPQREGYISIDPKNEDQYAFVFDPTSGKTLLMLSSGN